MNSVEDANYITILEENQEGLLRRLDEERQKLRRILISLAGANGGSVFIPDIAWRGDVSIDVVRDERDMGWRVSLRHR